MLQLAVFKAIERAISWNVAMLYGGGNCWLINPASNGMR